MDKTVNPPMLPNRVFIEQINVKVDGETKRNAQLLKGHGVDTAALFRAKILEAIREAFDILEEENAS